jgi:hypothetical protein
MIGQQHHIAPVFLDSIQTSHQPRPGFAPLAVSQRVDELIRHIQHVRTIFDRHRLPLAHLVQRQVAGDNRHPGDRRACARIECACPPPDAQVSLLHNFVRQIFPLKDTKDNAIEFRGGCAEQRMKSLPIPGGYAPQKLDEIAGRSRWTCHCVFLRRCPLVSIYARSGEWITGAGRSRFSTGTSRTYMPAYHE